MDVTFECVGSAHALDRWTEAVPRQRIVIRVVSRLGATGVEPTEGALEDMASEGVVCDPVTW